MGAEVPPIAGGVACQVPEGVLADLGQRLQGPGRGDDPPEGERPVIFPSGR